MSSKQIEVFRQQLTGAQEPDLVLLSVVAGCVENCMTTTKLASTHTPQVSTSLSPIRFHSLQFFS